MEKSFPLLVEWEFPAGRGSFRTTKSLYLAWIGIQRASSVEGIKREDSGISIHLPHIRVRRSGHVWSSKPHVSPSELARVEMDLLGGPCNLD